VSPARTFLALSIARRDLAFEQAAAARGLNAAILEKDFWVCWLVCVLFAQSEIGPHLVFKGGTSLSKVFGVIDRFSEDVDLSVSPEFVGANARAIEVLPSRARRDAAMAAMQESCCRKARD
jgi:predicted nucleotidyltransferase component of viral defense system